MRIACCRLGQVKVTILADKAAIPRIPRASQGTPGGIFCAPKQHTRVFAMARVIGVSKTPDNSQSPSSPQDSGQPVTPSPHSPSGAGSKRKSDRDLIHEALEQLTPRLDGEHASEVALDSFPGYDILREIHRGGQGVVYQAVQRTTKRKVAVKLIHGGPFTGSSGKARFEREVQILGQLQHPNIVGIIDSGQTNDGSYYYVMDYISGRSLDEVLRETHSTHNISNDRSKPKTRPGTNIDDTLKLFIKICEAVNAAHLRGVIHRDLKPANVRIDHTGEPVVVDFGLAKVMSGDDTSAENRAMTLTGQFVGSLPWASPEQAVGSPDAVDVRSDVYSLGVMLYQMLTGKFPYTVVGNMRDVLDNILNAQPSRPSTIRRQINNEVETIILKCLSKEKDRRYQNAGELARDLHHYLRGEPIEAKRDSGLYVITKTLARYKAAAAVAGLFLVTIITFGIVMTILYQQSEHNKRIAEAATVQAQQALEGQTSERRRADQNARTAFDFAVSTTNTAAMQIAQVQGGTPALKSLVEGSLKKLQSLEPQIETDATMMRTLAGAYHRMSEFQSDLYDGREGDIEASKSNHQRALAIRQKLAASQPESWSAAFDLGKSLQRGAMIVQGNRDYLGARAGLEAAISQYERALAIVTKAPASDPAEVQELRTAYLTSLRAQTYTYYRVAEDAAKVTLAQIETARQLLDETSKRYDTLQQRLAELSTRAGFEKLTPRQAAIARDEANRIVVMRADLCTRAAEAHFAQGSSELALEEYNKGLGVLDLADREGEKIKALFDAMKVANPNAAESEHDLFITKHGQGESATQRAELKDSAVDKCNFVEFAESRRSDHQRALQYYEAALIHAQAAKNSDPWRIRFTRSLGVAYLKLARTHLSMGSIEDARMAVESTLEIRRDVLKTDSVARHRRDLGAGLYKAAEVFRTLGDAASDPEPREAAWARSEALISEARTLFELLRDQEVITAEASELRITLQEQSNLWYHMGIDAVARGKYEPARVLLTQAKGNLAIFGDAVLAWPWQATTQRIDAALAKLPTP